MADMVPRHIRALDGIRGFAVILVFCFHAFGTGMALDSPISPIFQWAFLRCWIGVDLFFVLSGFLITSILLRTGDAANYYRVFYGRRALRILPLYYLVMFGGMLALHVHPPLRFQIWYWLNLSNLVSAFQPMLIPCLSHYWSLAIEEQFYFAWPAVVRKVSSKTLARLSLAAIFSCLVLRNLPTVLAWDHRWPDLVYRLTPFRIDTLCGGALLAVVIYRKVELDKFRWFLRTGCATGAAIFVISSLSSDGVLRFGLTGLTLCFTSLLALVLNPENWTARFFANGFLRRMGMYSYCFYLIHIFVLIHRPFVLRMLMRAHLTSTIPHVTDILVAAILFASTFALCAISYKFFESPILGLKKYLPYRRLEQQNAASVSGGADSSTAPA